MITLADAVTITGRHSTQTADVALDGLSVAFRPLKEFPVEANVLRTTPRDPVNPLHPEIRVARDGTFTATAVPVLYDVVANGLPSGAYVAAIRQGETSQGTLHVRPQSNAPIEIAVNTDGGIVEGRVLNPGNAPATMVLAAADPARSTYFKETTSAADGTFRFESVPPGEYRLAAFEKILLGAAYTQAPMSKFPLSSAAVRVPPCSTVRVDIRVSAILASLAPLRGCPASLPYLSSSLGQRFRFWSNVFVAQNRSPRRDACQTSLCNSFSRFPYSVS